MSGSPPERPSLSSRAKRFTTMPAFLAVVLLLIEYWLLKQRFSTNALLESPLWWAPLVRWLRFNTSWGVCIVAAALLIGRSRIFAAFRTPSDKLSRPRSLWPILGGHLLALGTFYLLTVRLLEGDVSQGLLAVLLPIPWILSGAAAVILLAALVAPVRTLAMIALQLRWVAFGGLVLGSVAFAIWSFLADAWPLWEPMSRGTMWLADRLLGLFFADRVYEPEQLVLGTDAFPVYVSQYCSGYEGVSLFLVFFCVFLALWRERLRFPQALLLLPLGALGAWLLNAVRIAVLIVVGTLVSPAAAMDGFHVYAGWPLLCGVALGCVALGTRLPLFSAVRSSPSTGVNPTALYLGPLLAWVGTAMVAGAFSPSPLTLYPLRLAPVLLVLWISRREHSQLRPDWSWSAAGLGLAAFLVWAALVHAFPIGLGSERAGEDVGGGGPAFSPVWSALWWMARIAGTCAVVPIVEELAFRGYLTRRLIAADFERIPPGTLTWPSFLLSSLAFGLLHSSWPAGAAAGMIYAFAYRRRGRLFDAVLAHSVTNALVVVVALTTGDRQLWG